MIKDYYLINTDLYLEFWHEHFHPAIWTEPSDSLKEALLKTHELFATDAHISRNDHVVDLGCGVGAFSFYLAETLGCHVTGINISKYQIEKANKKKEQLKIDNVDFLEMDIMNMNRIQDKFDAAFLIDVGVHFPDKKRGLTNIFKILKDDSRLIISDWLQKDNPSQFERTVFLEPFCQYWAYPYMISLPQYQKILTNIGFNVIKANDMSEQVKKNWELFYDLTLQTISNYSLLQMFGLIKNRARVIWKLKTKALATIKTAAFANIFTKVCSDAGVFRWGYIVANKDATHNN